MPTTLTFTGCIQPHQAWFLKMATVRYPSLYQMNTRVWLTEFSRNLGRRCSLEYIPDSELDHLAELGFDWIWFLSVRPVFPDLAGRKWKLQDQLSSASYEWNGDDLAERGMYLDMAPWQAAVFDLVIQ